MAVSAALVTGCGGGSSTSAGFFTVSDADHDLAAENARLRERERLLRDSLRLYDDVAAGRVAREMRLMQDQLARMAFELATLRDGGRTLATLPVDDLFAPASDSLTDAGRASLDALAEQMRASYPERRFRVEGHADSTPLSEALQRRFASNWMLSAARAAAVVHYLAGRDGLTGEQFVAVGLGSTQPVAGNDTARGRRLNRRVRVAVLPVPRDYGQEAGMSW